jgi:hypothetical protein
VRVQGGHALLVRELDDVSVPGQGPDGGDDAVAGGTTGVPSGAG